MEFERPDRQMGVSNVMEPRQDETVARARAEIIIGEIPAAEDPSTMLWTARCTESTHDLLGHFGTRSQAEDAGARHLPLSHHDQTH